MKMTLTYEFEDEAEATIYLSARKNYSLLSDIQGTIRNFEKYSLPAATEDALPGEDVDHEESLKEVLDTVETFIAELKQCLLEYDWE